MSEINVMDASAVLALLQKEKGHQVMTVALLAQESFISSVNYCEILSKLREKGMPGGEAMRAVDELQMRLVDFDRELALHAAELRMTTMTIGASLGDRACLALAEQRLTGVDIPTVYTAEKVWTSLPWPFKVIVIR